MASGAEVASDPSIKAATALVIAFALALHTYTAAVLASAFHAGFWLWSLSPYLVATLLLWKGRWPRATLGAALLPALADVAMHVSVFHFPRGSTAALGLFAAPLWNLILLLPPGALLGWLADRRAEGRGTRPMHP
jgi:hypothetical protein